MSHGIYVKEMLMSMDAKKKMYAFWNKLALRENFVQAPVQLTVNMEKFFVGAKLIGLIPSTKVAEVKMFAK